MVVTTVGVVVFWLIDTVFSIPLCFDCVDCIVVDEYNN